MTVFMQAGGIALLAVILTLTLSGHSRDISAILGIAACCMVFLAAAEYLEPVIAFVQELETLGDLDSGTVQTLLKAVGIGMISEIAALVCTDAGNASLGRTLQILASATILCLSLPLYRSVITLLQKILGEI